MMQIATTIADSRGEEFLQFVRDDLAVVVAIGVRSTNASVANGESEDYLFVCLCVSGVVKTSKII